MFEGVQDQFHQFLAAAAATSPIRASPNSLPLPPLSFSLLHGSSSSSSSLSNSFPIFDPYPSLPPPHPPTHHHILQQQLHLQIPPSKLGVKQEGEGESTGGFLSTSLVLEKERSMAPDSIDPWSNDEVLALLRIRSAMENWFPEFTWEHVSSKLAEVGFKRSPQKCKEKFEEESRYLHSTTTTTSIARDSCPTKNYRLFSELEELYHHGYDPPPPLSDHHHQQQNFIPWDGCENQNEVVLNKQNPQGKEQEPEDDDDDEQLGGAEGQEERGGQDKMGQERLLEKNDCSEATDHHQVTDRMDEVEEETKMQRKKRRSYNHHMNSKKKFEIFKSFCEEIVSKMMAQQEELHNKILEDMIKRDEEKIAREEVWKRQEIERINKETEARARDQAMVNERQVKIVEFLKQFTSNSPTINNNDDNDVFIKTVNASGFAPIFSTHENPSSSATPSSPTHIPTSSNDESFSQTTSNPSPKTSKNQSNPRKPRPNERPYNDNCNDINETGKRWPREEVLALINIRCSIDLANNTGPDDSNGNSSNTKNPPLWERISKRMMELGHKRSAKRCKEKWENINKYFRKTKDNNKKRSVDSRTCPYFHQLSNLYSQGRIMGGAHGGGRGGSSGAMTANVGDDLGEDHYVVQVTTSACDFEI